MSVTRSPSASVTVTFRVLTYNVRGLRDDVDAVVDLVRGCDPDVVCLQETPRFLRWRSRLAALSRRSGLLYVTGGATTGGVALLSHLRNDVTDAREDRFVRRRGMHQRGLASAVLARSGASLLVGSTHLSLDRAERVAQVPELVACLADRPGGGTVVAGDLNERPGGPTWSALADAGLRDLGPASGPTFPAAEPDRRIDAVLGSQDVSPGEVLVLDGPAVRRGSDHRPLVAVVSVPVTA